MYDRIKEVAEKNDTEFRSSYYDSISNSFCISFASRDMDIRNDDIEKITSILNDSYRISISNVGNEVYINIYFYAENGGNNIV